MTVEEYINNYIEKCNEIGYDNVRDYVSKHWSPDKSNGSYVYTIKDMLGQETDVAVLPHILPIDYSNQKGEFHNHDYFELVYVWHGSCTNVFVNEEKILHEGVILLLNPNIKHEIYTLHKSDILFNIIISKSIYEKSMASLLADNNLFSDFFIDYMYQINRVQDYLYFNSTTDYSIRYLIRAIVEEYINQKKCYTNVIQAYLVILFAELLRLYSNQNNLDLYAQKQITTMKDIIVYISEHCSDITLESLAEHFKYSPGHLSKKIYKNTGKKFISIVHKFKLEKAKNYLESSDYSIAQISELVGYNDASYLHKTFKNTFGVTPSEYRKYL